MPFDSFFFISLDSDGNIAIVEITFKGNEYRLAPLNTVVVCEGEKITAMSVVRDSVWLGTAEGV